MSFSFDTIVYVYYSYRDGAVAEHAHSNRAPKEHDVETLSRWILTGSRGTAFVKSSFAPLQTIFNIVANNSELYFDSCKFATRSHGAYFIFPSSVSLTRPQPAAAAAAVRRVPGRSAATAS
jgi:hypothetical protein